MVARDVDKTDLIAFWARKERREYLAKLGRELINSRGATAAQGRTRPVHSHNGKFVVLPTRSRMCHRR